MITEFYTFELADMKSKNELISKLNELYSGKSITFKVHRQINRQTSAVEESYIIDKFFYKEPIILDKERRKGSLQIILKTRAGKLEIEITSENVYFIEEFEYPKLISHYDETLQTIINNYRKF